jgi:hypothetical protein
MQLNGPDYLFKPPLWVAIDDRELGHRRLAASGGW